MPARYRYLRQSRLLIAATGFWIQLKRVGLGLRRVFPETFESFGSLFAKVGSGLIWMLSLPFRGLRSLWTVLDQPEDETEPIRPRIANFEETDRDEVAPPVGRVAGISWRSLKKSARVSSIYLKRAGQRTRQTFQKQTAWTLATITGTLGILLMLILQLIYSFQTLKAKESPPAESVTHHAAKTLIDPGLPQVRPLETEEITFAQIDPYAQAQPDPDRSPPVEPETFVDPLDNLPPFDPPRNEPEPMPPLEPAGDPFPEIPPVPEVQPEPARESTPPQTEPAFVDPLDNLPPFQPAPFERRPEPEPGIPSDAFPEPSPVKPVPDPMPDPFVDPLDTLPPLEPMPREQDLGPKSEPNPFIDPLETLPPSEPMPRQPEPEPNASEPEAELAVGFLRLPAEQDEHFVLESSVELRRAILSQAVDHDAWDRYLEGARSEPRRLRPYSDRFSPEDWARIEPEFPDNETASDDLADQPKPEGDLTIAIAKNLPPKTAAFEPLRYQIVVENRGEEMIESVDVNEAVPPTHELTDANPPGHFENNLLRWRLKDIRPGEERRLTVEVVPSETGTIETTTSVRPSTRVASLTEVEKSPALRIRRSGYRTIALEEPVGFTNHVQNLSGAAVRDLVIVEQVPAGYRVVRVEDFGVHDQQAGTITWKLAALEAGKTAMLSVTLQAESRGELVSRVKCSSRDSQAVPILARVYAGPVEARRASVSQIRPIAQVPSWSHCPTCGFRCRCISCRCR